MIFVRSRRPEVVPQVSHRGTIERIVTRLSAIPA